MFLMIILPLWFVLPSYADSFTDLQMGARPAGMGGAFVAIADDANALYWNPAGLIQNTFVEFTTMHGIPFGIKTLSTDYIAYAQPLGLRYGFGVSFLRNAAKLEEGVLKKTSKMTEDTYTLTLASAVNSKVSLGTTIKRLAIETKIESGAGFGFDFGILYKYSDRISFGTMFRNLAADVKDEKVPNVFRVGTAIKWGKNLLLALDVNGKEGINNQEETTYLLHLGAEKKFGRNFAFRIGSDQDQNLSFGLGFIYRTWVMDYAYYKSNADLDYSHRLSLSLHYNE